MTTMKAMRIPEPNARLELVEVEILEPGLDQVLVKVEACGVCHGDTMAIGGMASAYPRIPGHEVVGTVEKVGGEGCPVKVGQRVGIGWHGGRGTVTGLTQDGGYAQYLVAFADSVISIPDELSSAQAAPLLCAGQTVFSALRESGARPGDLVAIAGVGGLGHLAVQYAHRCGFEVAAISRTDSKRELVEQLGADHYIATAEEDAAARLQELGGARVILATLPDPDAIKPLVGGLASGGELILAATSTDPIGWSAMDFIGGVASVKGTFTDAGQIERTLKFSSLFNVRPLIEEYPLERANEALDAMLSARTRFRAVLVM